MAEPAERAAATTTSSGVWPIIKKRWRAWLRAFHRDFGYLAIGFTVIYAVSGIAQNHIEDWGEVSYRTYQSTKTIAPIPDEATDEEAVAKVAALVDFGTPSSTFRAGDEVRLEYANGAKVTAIGSEVTIQGRERRAFIGVANWLHTARNKKGWKYVADVYALLLLYLAISGIFMIKGKLGLKGRGAVLISLGIAVPVIAVLSSGPDARKAAETTTVDKPPADGIKFLPPEAPAEAPVAPSEPTPCDPFGSMHGCKPTASGAAPEVTPSDDASDPAQPKCDPFGQMHGCKPSKK